MLTLKMEKFCNELLISGCQSEAYRQAFNAKNMKPQSIHSEAYKLLQNPEITHRLQVLRSAIAAKYELTTDDLVSELEAARQVAIKNEQPAAMCTATMGKAKILGLITDKSQVTLLSPANELSRLKRQAQDALKHTCTTNAAGIG
jgi:hypothetical protein